VQRKGSSSGSRADAKSSPARGAAAASGPLTARVTPRPRTPRHIVLAGVLERWLPVGVLVLAVIGAPVLILSPQGLPRLRGLEKELADVEEENASMRREIEELRGKVARLRDDPAAVERIARDDLGLLRQTEVVFQFPVRR
jgi:cell division protein FtsB